MTEPRVGVSLLMKFFGRLPGQTLADFAAEARQLTDADFTEIKAGIENGSLTY